MHRNKINWTKTQNTYAYLLLQEETSLVFTVSRKTLTDWKIFQPKFQERIYTTLEHKESTWLDDNMFVTKGNMEKRDAEVRETRTKQGQAGYR